MAHQHGRCFYCGSDIIKVRFEIDHFLPFSKYKIGTSDNLVLSCVDCNRTKSDKEIEVFKEYIKANYPEKLIRGMFYFEFLNLKNG